MSACVMIQCAAGSHDEATMIAAALVERRLAACVQLAPIESWYRWEGAVQHAPEVMLHIKTLATRTDAVEQAIRTLHSYAVPEIIVVPILGGEADYLAWIAESVSG